jgi:hypothetical protein
MEGVYNMKGEAVHNGLYLYTLVRADFVSTEWKVED